MAALLVDPATIDPRHILAGIAADTSAPASARVSACRALLAKDQPGEQAGNALTERAIRLMAERRKVN